MTLTIVRYFALAAVLASTLVHAEGVQDLAHQKTDPLSLGCHSTPSFGSLHSLMAVCISNHGNVNDFTTLGSTGAFDNLVSEGYAVCRGMDAIAWDMSSTESGWGPSTITQAGPNKLPLTITRSTNNGQFRLVQKFTWNTTERELYLEIKLTNTSGVNQSAIKFDRLVNGRVSSTNGGEIVHATLDSVSFWGAGPSGSPVGIMLSNRSRPGGASHKYQVGVAYSSFTMNPAQCGQQGNRSFGPGDGSGRISYHWDSIPAGATKTIKMKYSRY